MGVQWIIDNRKIPSGEPTAVLEEAKAKVDQIILHLKYAESAAAQIVLVDYQDLQKRLQDVINQRRGLDGMTLLTT